MTAAWWVVPITIRVTFLPIDGTGYENLLRAVHWTEVPIG